MYCNKHLAHIINIYCLILTISTPSNFNGLFHSLCWIELNRSVGLMRYITLNISGSGGTKIKTFSIGWGWGDGTLKICSFILYIENVLILTYGLDSNNVVPLPQEHFYWDIPKLFIHLCCAKL